MVDIHSNLEYLCRVCAANTKGKNSVAECVYILKTAGLKDKLDKFLYLKISENDSLPKVLCKSCFRQVEATASLSKIAKHTQQVFRDFLLSNLPKGPSDNTCTTEFTSSDLMGNKDLNKKSKKDEPVVPTLPTNTFVQLLAPSLAPPPPPPPLTQPLPMPSRKDEVIVNVSVADPLTRDNQQKMISNSQRRQSLLLESRFTPKSIAQKPATTAAALRRIAPKVNQPLETVNTTNNPKASAPTLNFYPVKTQQSPQATQITTFSSGGYVIGRINTATSEKDKEEVNNATLPLTTAADNILQQKRKNLVKALNNIKANNSGQVSLLKSSQQKQAEAILNATKTPLSEVANQAAEDELPEKIIIAAPKNKFMMEKSKKEPLNLSSKTPVSLTQHPVSSAPAGTSTPMMQQQQEHTPLKPAFPEDILLGRVIRDVDLLKLILKALKWPVDEQNIELQLQRLKNSKFTDIMSDPNLLQDTDLTQLLGPYLAPVLLAAQALQQQQQHVLRNSTLNQNVPEPKMTALEAAQAEINKSIPYKLPPETSVQLVPATPEETEAAQSSPLHNTTTTTRITVRADDQKETKTVAVAQKRKRRAAAQKARDSIVISDEEDASIEEEATKKPRQSASKSASNLHIELNPNFLAHYNFLNGSGSNETEELMALLLKQKAALLKDKKIQRRRRNSISNLITLPPSEFDALIDLDDDIVLMEPVTTTSSTETSFSNQVLQQQKTDATNTFVIPPAPLITRPIIKRRKTVIHSPKNVFDLSAELKNKNQKQHISFASVLQSKEKHVEETINQVATGNITNAENTNPSKPVNNEGSVSVAAAELPSIKASQQKKLQNKSNLGQQLLEAIGLQKISQKTMSNPQAEAATSTQSNATTVLPNSKQSIQQIRSALKKSLKLAQEQQQQKKKDLSSSNSNTIIQDADSTTKTVVKEVVVVEGKGNKSDNSSSIVDVEEQIDKVTLMVRKNEEETSEQSKAKIATTEKDHKNEMKKSANSKIQERRRTLLANAIREIVANSCADADKEKYNKEGLQEKIIKNKETTAENEKSEKDDSDHLRLSSEATVTTNDEVITPKRRGRKRLVDKQTEIDAAELNEKSHKFDKSREDESEATNSIKMEEEIESYKTSGRPTRQSKTQSKYYKGPEQLTQGRRSLPSRTTRNRRYC